MGYRYALRREAERLGIAGWVRNRADGSVESVVQGDADAVARILQWARRGPAAALVEDLIEQAPDPEFDCAYVRFELRANL